MSFALDFWKVFWLFNKYIKGKWIYNKKKIQVFPGFKLFLNKKKLKVNHTWVLPSF